MVDLVITIVGAKDLPLVQGNRKPNSLVRLTAEQSPPRNTRVRKRSTEPVWEKEFLLKGIGDSSLLLLQVFHLPLKCSLFGETNLGIATIKVNELLEKQKDSEKVILSLATGSISVRARQADGPASDIAAVRVENEAPDAMNQVVRSLRTVTTVVGIISEMNPFLKVTLNSSLMLLNSFQSAADVDDKLLHLVRLMGDTYAQIEHLQTLEDMHPRLQEIIRQILILTTECTLFIQGSVTQSTVARHLNSALISSKIGEFNQAFLTLRHSLETGLAIQVNQISVRIENLAGLDMMRTFLNPVEMDWSGRPICLPNTRLDDLDFITQWLVAGHSQTLLWIHGVAGCGKSTLSATLADMFAQLHRLGAFLFFDRDRERSSDPHQVIRTMAYQLGLYDSQIARAIQHAIQENPHIINSPLSSQFHSLIRQPMEILSNTGPVIIILDALDECVPSPARSELVSILSQETSTLPSFARIIMTSRNDTYMRRSLENRPHVEIRDIGIAADKDISVFIQGKVEDIRLRHGLSENWPSPAHVGALTQQANGLFIWANVACRWIDGGHNPEERIKAIADGHSVEVGDLRLDALYASVLSNAGPWGDEDFRKEFQAIMGILLLVPDPIAPKTIDTILNVDALRLLSRFQSVLSCNSADEPVRILHISFCEYLQGCKGEPWYIDTDHHHRELAKKTSAIQNIFAEEK